MMAIILLRRWPSASHWCRLPPRSASVPSSQRAWQAWKNMSVSILKTVLVILDDLVFWILVLFMSQDDTHYQNHRNDPHELRVVRASMQYLKYRCALSYFWYISVGVIDGINIFNIWCYLCPIIACVKYRVVKFSNSFFEIICHPL